MFSWVFKESVGFLGAVFTFEKLVSSLSELLLESGLIGDFV